MILILNKKNPLKNKKQEEKKQYLTTKPHDEHHFRSDFMVSEKV